MKTQLKRGESKVSETTKSRENNKKNKAKK